MIKTSAGEQSIKCNAGDAVIYSSNSLHKVNEVTSGVRLVAVTWAQSLVKESTKREILFELSQARDALMDNQGNKTASNQVSNVYSNLLRRWSEL